jgi:hypothetical protein
MGIDWIFGTGIGFTDFNVWVSARFMVGSTVSARPSGLTP